MTILGSEINDLKSVFNKRQGAAFTNRFMVFMAPPNGSLLNLDREAALTKIIGGVFGGDGFNLGQIGGLLNDPRDISILCESCTLPGRTISTIDYQNVKQAVKVPYSFINEDVSFTFILTGDYYIRKMFDKWMSMVFDTESYQLRYKENYVSDVRIAQLNKNNIPVYTVKLQNAYPTAINAITLDNTAESSIQKVTVNVTYESFVVEGMFDAAKGVLKGLGGAASNALDTAAGALGRIGL
jgi:hypothetical protein